MSRRELVVAIVYTWCSAFCVPVPSPLDQPHGASFWLFGVSVGSGDLPQSTGVYAKEVKKYFYAASPETSPGPEADCRRSMLKGSGARYGWPLSSVLAGDHPGLPCPRWETV